MASRLEDFHRDFDLVEYVMQRKQYTKVARGVMISCPFHHEDTPSLYVTKERAYCFGCGKNISAARFLQEVDNIRYSDLSRTGFSYKQEKKRKPVIIHEEFIELAHNALLSSNRQLMYLVKERKINVQTIKQYKIGYITPPFPKFATPRYCFPGWDIYGKLSTVSYRQDPFLSYPAIYPENKKYIIHTGTSAIPYNIQNVNKRNFVVYCGGQIDALSLIQFNVPAVGAMGEGTFKESWIPFFENINVFILLDNDAAGRLGAEKVLAKLPRSIVVCWPDGVPEKYDVNSAIVDRSFGIGRVKEMLKQVGADI